MRAAVVLSGCGYLDGAEIREGVLSLLYLDVNGVDVSVFAPDIQHHHVLNHISGEPQEQTRNVLEESARIARGQITALSQLEADAFDLLVIPGGFGVAKNLSDFAFKGQSAVVLNDFQSAIQQFYQAQKPIAAICIAPAIVALALPNEHISLTVGREGDVAQVIAESGNRHIVCAADEVCVDDDKRVLSCSAYMEDAPLASIAKGIEKVIAHAVEMARKAQQSTAV